MIKVREWAMIHTYYQEGTPKSRIAEAVGVDPKTVYRALAQENCQGKARRAKSSILDPYKPYNNHKNVDFYIDTDTTATVASDKNLCLKAGRNLHSQC